MTKIGDMIDALEAQGFGYGMSREDRDRAKEKSIAQRTAREVDLTVTLPDGQVVTKRTARDYRYAVAVLVPNDELEPAHWEVFRWVTTNRYTLNKAHDEANTIYFQTAVLDVTKKED